LKVIVRYHEIALKGGNRGFFVGKLADNLRRACADLGELRVRQLAGRIALEAGPGVSEAALCERLATVFGVANFSPFSEAPLELAALREHVLETLRGRSFASFRVRARRSFKGYPLGSMELERELGAAVARASGARVDLGAAELTVYLEVLKDRVLVSFDKQRGAGGFPAGSSGKVAALLSGGIDSPVAAWRMMKRGCSVLLVHFHAFPLQDHATIDKAQALARILTRWQLRTRLLLVPFAPVQQTIVAAAPAPLRVVLYRRFMLRIAEALAVRRRAKALVTGESLGQVASQTLDNMAAIDEAARLPVLRPLVGMDKEEITAEARRIGSFETSTLPDQDCCQLFVPPHPAIAASLADLRRAEEGLDLAALVAEAVHDTQEARFTFPEVAAHVPDGRPAV
jgi:thiamine biosynthesis protein ThiI